MMHLNKSPLCHNKLECGCFTDENRFQVHLKSKDDFRSWGHMLSNNTK